MPRALPSVTRSLTLRRVTAGVVLVAVLGGSFALLVDTTERQRDSEARHQEAVDRVDRAREVLTLVLDAETGSRGFVITGERSFLEPWMAARMRLPRATHALGEHLWSGGPEGRLVAEVIRRAEDYMSDHSVPLVELARRDRAAAQAAVKTAAGKRRVDDLRARFARLAERDGRLGARLERESKSATDRARGLAVTGLFLSVLMVLALLGYVAQTVLGPVRRTAAAAARLRDGDLAARVPDPGTRELAELATAFNAMADSLEHGEADLRRRNLELEEARRQADAANLAKSEFLSRMSHELRTPLNSVLGFSQLLALDDLTPEQHDALGHIDRSGRHLLALINEILDIARIEAGRLSLSLEPVAVGAAISDAVASIGPLADERGVAVHVGAEPGLFVRADQQRLKQVLLNLLSNAVKYNEESGEVRIHAARAGERVRIAISDTGPGIPPDSLDAVFEPFERVGADEAVEGTGLGLPLCRRLCELMGGRVVVESALGLGTTFTVDLGAEQAPAGPTRRELALSPVRPGRSSARVLYVEDNLTNLQLVERALGRRGVTVRGAVDGASAARLAESETFDVVLLDLHLPDGTGEEVLARLRSTPGTREVPVVVLSADATPGRIRRLLEEGGVDGYLTKPLDLGALNATFDALLEEELQTS